MATWSELLKKEFDKNGDDFDAKVCVLTLEELDVEFYDGYGLPNGKPFLAWGDKFVYFPVCYDGAEWVGSVPRNPTDNIEIEHFGG